MTDDIVQRLRQSYHLADVQPDHILRRACEEIERLRAELALERLGLDYDPPAPSAEPVAWLYQHGETGRTRIVLPDHVLTNGPGQWLLVSPLYATPPDHREAMRLALDWLIAEQRAGDEDCGDPRCDECEGVTRPRQRVIDALRSALGARAKAQREKPSACASQDGDEMCDACDCWKSARAYCG
jgi:hypothetical protein